MNDSVRQRLEDLVKKNDVVLFMKGSRHFPQCGFSAQVIGILNELGPKYETVNVLADADVREGIKEYSSWPTIPQLYVKGTFVGGCDIVKEMHASGELRTLLGAAPPKAPSIAITASAARAFRDAAGEAGGDVLRLEITPEFQYDLHFAPSLPTDVPVTAGDVTIHVEAASAGRADGMTIDFVSEGGGGFKMENPNEPPRVKALRPKELAELLAKRARGEAKLELLDVRTPQERATASIEGSRPLDQETEKAIGGDTSAMLVFYCHHGMRSRNAAEQFLRDGFKNVWNLEGGIDAWSTNVDPSVTRY